MPKPLSRPEGAPPVELVGPAAAALLTLLLYVRTLGYRFTWDDVPLIVRNPVMARAVGWLDCLRGSFWGTYGRERAAADFYRPLASLSFWADWHFWARRAAGFHLTNVLAAALGAALLVLLLRSRGVSRLAAGLAGALFAVSPLRVHSVAWVSGRTDVLCFGFFAAFLWLWPRDAGAAGGERLRAGAASTRLGASLACLLLASASKELALLAPLALAWEIAVLPPAATADGARRDARGAWRRAAWSRLAWLLIPLGAFLLARAAVLGGAPGLPDLASKAGGVGAAALLYGRLLLWPFGALPEYGYPPRLHAPDAVLGVAGWLALLAAACLPAAGARTRWCAGLALLFALPALLPGLAAARFLYFSAAFAAAALCCALEARPALLRGVGLVLCVACAAEAWARTGAWRDNLTLFDACVRGAPQVARSWINDGVALEEAGRLAAAESALRRAQALDPTDDRAPGNLSLVLRKEGRYAEAESLAMESLRLEPGNVDARFNHATVLYAAGRLGEAAEEFRRGLAVRDDPRARLGLALALSDAGDASGALQEYRAYLAASPSDSLDVRGSIAWELHRLGRDGEAEAEARASVSGGKPASLSLFNLGIILLSKGDEAGAVEAYERGLQADTTGGTWASAAGDIVEGIRSGRDVAGAHYALGLFAGHAGLPQAQAREGQRYLRLSPGGPGAAEARRWARRWDARAAEREAATPARGASVEGLRRLLWGK